MADLRRFTRILSGVADFRGLSWILPRANPRNHGLRIFPRTNPRNPRKSVKSVFNTL
ncbi:MAG: hypothetical protein FWG87_08405 [Defluviitaleaceae bacterium]|nr:hypothetical protein [Defluviitaleaceae bacterium]